MSVNVYKVGGCIRDKLLGRQNNDIDYAIETESYDRMKEHININYKILYEKPEFQTIKAKDVNNKVFDFVLCRKESKYLDSRHPSIVQVGTIEDDLSRRDFTINALAEDKNGKILDYFGGLNDLNSKLLKTVQNTKQCFADDSLRILRAMRFCITLKFNLHEDIIQNLHDEKMINGLDNVSLDRIVVELNKCLSLSVIDTLNFLCTYKELSEYLFNRRKIVVLSKKTE